MRRNVAILVLGLGAVAAGARADSSTAAQPPAPPRPPAKVLLLGTFHFQDAGLDDYRPQHDPHVLSAERQQEVAEVVRCLGDFQPTMIAVEALPQEGDRLRQELASFLSGGFELPANEIYQLGFRLAEQQGLSRLHPIDAEGRWYEPFVDPEEWAVEHEQAAALIESETPWEAFYQAYYAYQDESNAQQTLRQHLMEINDESAILLSHGHYLLGTFKVGRDDAYPGADAKTGWYNRNLRIFANFHRVLSGPEDRLLVIIGSGHLAILRHAVQASPELELVEARDYLGEGCAG